MNEEIEFILDSAKEGMNSALAHLVKELSNYERQSWIQPHE